MRVVKMSKYVWGDDVADVVMPTNTRITHSLFPRSIPYNDVGDVVSQALLLARSETSS